MFNAVYGNNLWLLWKTYETHKHIDGAKSRDFSVKGLEHVFANCFGIMYICPSMLVFSMWRFFYFLQLNYLTRSEEHRVKEKSLEIIWRCGSYSFVLQFVISHIAVTRVYEAPHGCCHSPCGKYGTESIFVLQFAHCFLFSNPISVLASISDFHDVFQPKICFVCMFIYFTFNTTCFCYCKLFYWCQYNCYYCIFFTKPAETNTYTNNMWK